jgi:hypothetical protein
MPPAGGAASLAARYHARMLLPMAGTSRHHYSSAALRGDYWRVAGGLAATLGPALLAEPAPLVLAMLLGLAGLFGWFGLRTLAKQRSWIELSPSGIALHGPFGRSLRWRDLARLRLACYAPRRVQAGSWLQLTLTTGGGQSIPIDSAIEGFDQILQRAHAAARANQIELDPTTLANLSACGLEP